MTEQYRYYSVGEQTFRIELDSYWQEMPYTEAVEDRIRKAAEGLPTGMPPVRAGDRIPPRTYVASKSELPDGFGRNMLDLSQYEPFRLISPDMDNVAFSLKMCAPENEPLCGVERKLIVKVEDIEQGYNVYSVDGGTLYEFMNSKGCVVATYLISSDYKNSSLWPSVDVGPYTVVFYLGMATRIAYSCVAPFSKRLLLHSSVVAHNFKSVLFLGASGTGKSTHSRIWLENVPGAELVNDDNPVVRLSGNALYVYGTPWSGKTPCYRNVKSPVRAIVRLTQASKNEVRGLSGIDAYASFIGSVSCAKWDRGAMDKVTSLCSDIVAASRFFALKCRPDVEAVELCRQAVELEAVSK